MTRRIPAALLALALVAGCSDAGGEPDESDGTGSEATTSTTTSTTAPATTTSTTAPAPVAPRDPANAADAAAQLNAVDAALRQARPDDPAFAAASKQQQLTYRVVSAHPEWDAEVRRGLPAELHAALDANVTANRELRALTKPRTSLPPWHIVAPAPADELLGYYREAERTFGVPWQFLASIHLVETRMGRIRGDSSAGAKGPMQFMPATWAAYGGGGDIESNHDAVFAAARYLKANGAPSDMDNALWNYNHSDHYVRAVSLYAAQMKADERNYRAYWHWDVYYRLTTGDVLLPVGWSSAG